MRLGPTVKVSLIYGLMTLRVASGLPSLALKLSVYLGGIVMMYRFLIAGVSGVALAACGAGTEVEPPETDIAAESETETVWRRMDPGEAVDPFTYSNYNDVRVTHLALDLDVSFEKKTLSGQAILSFDRINPDAVTLVLDADDLAISLVEAKVGDTWLTTGFKVGPDEDVVGSRFEISLPDGADDVRVTYETSPQAAGLQWLTPEQTSGKEHPFLFSQFQPLLARTMAPVQDTPAVRMTYEATIRTPPELIALMSARQDPTGERDGEYQFVMSQPIPSYLLAIAVGDLRRAQISDTMAVYAEAEIVGAAAEEFEDTPAMETATEALYGDYRWGRYDLLVLPPSFPFGGMENPRLSYLTPTLIAGDKSLTNVVAHELAHSWSGNLVTNSTWRDAWLNEGFTSYVENRIMESLYGENRAVMERSLDKASLMRDVAEAERPELTALKMPADLGHPDDAFSQVSYAGGMFFLKFLEERFGRDDFDAFLKSYFDEFAFQSITTEDFLAFFEDNLWAENQDKVSVEEINAWIYEPGFPDTIENPQSDAFSNISNQIDLWMGADIELSAIDATEWTTHEWLHFINSLPLDGLSEARMVSLDDRFELSSAQNAEIANAWYLKAIALDYEPAFVGLEAFLLRVGRGKFIYRLYQTLVDEGHGEWAQSVYDNARAGYHPIAQRRIDAIFAG